MAAWGFGRYFDGGWWVFGPAGFRAERFSGVKPGMLFRGGVSTVPVCEANAFAYSLAEEVELGATGFATADCLDINDIG